MRFLFVVLAALGSVAASWAQTDDVDYRLEDRFHQVYQKYHSTPTSEDSWGMARGKKNIFEYQVQKGDNLWEVSQVLFGDAYFWPKVWALNSKQIGNPHEINPKMKIQFFSGSTEEPPLASIVDSITRTQEEVPAEAQESQEIQAVLTLSAEEQKKVEELRSKRRQSRPLLREIPPSIPRYVIRPPNDVKEEIVLQLGNLKQPSKFRYLEYYGGPEVVEGAQGEVVEVPGGASTAGEYEEVLVHLKDPSQQTFYVIQSKELLRNPRGFRLENRIKVVEIQGQIEVKEVVNSEKGIYRAIVSHSIMPIEINSLLKAGPIPSFTVDRLPVRTDIVAKVLGGQYEGQRIYMSNNSLIFVEAGRAQGLNLGDCLEVYASNTARDEKSLAVENNKRIALVKIVQVEEKVATAYVLENTKEIVFGDIVGGNGGVYHPQEPHVSDRSETDDGSDTTKIDEEIEL